MTRQNRVRPSGEIVADPTRGLFMGNRGCIHDEAERIVKPFTTKAWLICLLNFKNDRVRFGAPCPEHYTPLFFLDEATALAAGHRPCGRCRAKDFKNFKTLWVKANAQYPLGPEQFITQIDRIVHGERIDRNGRKVTYRDTIEHLPNGTIITLPGDDNVYYLVWEDGLFEWSPQGYKSQIASPAAGTLVRVLTPRSVVRTLAEGYTPIVRLKTVGS